MNKSFAALGALALLYATPAAAQATTSSGPSIEDAQAFLKQVLTNGITRINLASTANTIKTTPRAVAEVSTRECSTRINYVGEWFGLPEQYVLVLDWTKAVEARPFYSDASKSEVLMLVSATHYRRSILETLPGVVIAPGSESMEPRLIAAAQTLIAKCSSQKSYGF